jgi:hypothetical protein
MDEDELKKRVTGNRKPIPIREVVGEPGPRPAGSSDPRDVPAPQAPGPPGLRGQRERPEGPRGKGASRKSRGGRKRRPDRKGTAPGRKELQRPPLERTPLEDLPFRNFEHDGREWIVRLTGQSSTGSAMDPGAPLMHLVFYSVSDPFVACGELLETGRSLDGLPELRLPELLARARLTPSANDSGR